MKSAPPSVHILIYSSASTTFGRFFENSARELQSIISEIFIPHLQTAQKIFASSSLV
ncbi:MAG: hypothetical protein ACQERB_08625 [Promethearchaeati archaeon]